MTITDLVDSIAAANGITKTQARTIVDSVLDAIGGAVAKGDEVALPGFGKFKVSDRPAREGRNPSTGEAIKIAASKAVKFTPAKSLKDRVSG